MSKMLKFKNSKKTGRRKTPVAGGSVLEEGKLGELDYTVFKRGVIHITDATETFLFKKDCDLFEKEIEKLNLNDLKDEEVIKIEGSGDNDTLVFTCKKGDIEITLKRREYGMLSKLKKILKTGIKK